MIWCYIHKDTCISSFDVDFWFLRFGIVMLFLLKSLLDPWCMWNKASNAMLIFHFWTFFIFLENVYKDLHDLHLPRMKLMRFQILLWSCCGFSYDVHVITCEFWKYAALRVYDQYAVVLSARHNSNVALVRIRAREFFKYALPFIHFPSYFLVWLHFIFKFFLKLLKII